VPLVHLAEVVNYFYFLVNGYVSIFTTKLCCTSCHSCLRGERKITSAFT